MASEIFGTAALFWVLIPLGLVGGALLLVVLSIGWIAGMVTRNRGRRRALMFADTMLTNADAIKANYGEYRATQKLNVLGVVNERSVDRAIDATSEERERRFTEGWERDFAGNAIPVRRSAGRAGSE